MANSIDGIPCFAASACESAGVHADCFRLLLVSVSSGRADFEVVFEFKVTASRLTNGFGVGLFEFKVAALRPTEGVGVGLSNLPNFGSKSSPSLESLGDIVKCRGICRGCFGDTLFKKRIVAVKVEIIE